MPTASPPRGIFRMNKGLRPDPETLLQAGMVVVLALLIARAWLSHLLVAYPFGVDLEIPLRAAERWVAGGDPYLASAFRAPPGPTQPFLYPPYVLPLVTPLLSLPRIVAVAAWVLILVLCAGFALRRLDIPRRWWPLVVAWPPLAEPLVGGNVQVLLFASFVACFYSPRTDRPSDGIAEPRPAPRDRWVHPSPGLAPGIQAAIVAAIKVSQPHAWLFVLRRAPVAAAAGAASVAAAALITLPIVGLDLWLDWIEQLWRARDPAWEMAGYALPDLLPGVGLLVSIAAAALVPFMPRHDAGAWVGLLATVGAFSLHIFGVLFLLPAMIRVRREAALLGAILIATYTYEGSWAGIAVVGVAFALGERLPALRSRPVSPTATQGASPAASIASPAK